MAERWNVHLQQVGGESRVGPFATEEDAIETLGLMVATRDSQGYRMVYVGGREWRSETHELTIWAGRE